MTQLKPSEKRMLVILLSGLFLLANVLGWAWYSSLMLRSERRLAGLKAKVNSLEVWRREAPAAEEKRAWIGEHLKEYADETARDTYLDNLVQNDLRSGLDLELISPRPLDPLMPTDELPFIRSRYETKVKGTWTDVMTFVYRLQKPSEFRFVPRVTMVPRKNEQNDAEQFVECFVTIEKWWAPESATADDVAANEQPAAPVVEAPVTAAVPTPEPAAAAAPAAEAAPAAVAAPEPVNSVNSVNPVNPGQ